MSERDRVRLLFESAMMKARAVISAMKTFLIDSQDGSAPTAAKWSVEILTLASFAEENWSFGYPTVRLGDNECKRNAYHPQQSSSETIQHQNTSREATKGVP